MKTTIILILAAVAATNYAATSSKVVCYYDHTSHHREGQGKFENTFLDQALQFCSHLIYGYAGIGEVNHKLVSLDETYDVIQNNFRAITNLKARYPGLRVFLSVGGAHDGKGDSKERSQKYLSLLENAEERLAFVNSAAPFLKTYGFDGLDLAWQFPETKPKKIRSTVGGWWHTIKTKVAGESVVDKKAEEHKEQFTALVRELAQNFRHDALSLSLSILPNVNSSLYFDVRNIVPSLDFVTLKAFDFYTPERNTKEADYPAPLYELLNRKFDENADYQVRFWLNSGAVNNKVILGIPTFARTWKLTEESGLTGVPPLTVAGPADAGPYTKLAGTLSHNEICMRLDNPQRVSHAAGIHLRKVGDPTHRYGTYAFRFPDSKDPNGIWAAYEDADTAGSKAAYAKAKGLGGIAVDDLTLDDFRGLCSGNRYPILRAAVVRM